MLVSRTKSTVGIIQPAIRAVRKYLVSILESKGSSRWTQGWRQMLEDSTDSGKHANTAPFSHSLLHIIL